MESEVTLSNGVVVVCQKIPPNILDLFEDEHQMPEPPMREARIVGGGKEMVPDAEDKDYQAELEVARRKRAEDLHVLIRDHVRLKEDPSLEVVGKMERYGIRPTPENVLRFVMEDYVIDWGAIQQEVLRLSTVTDEEVQAALQRFRDRLRGGAAPDEDGHTEEPIQGSG